MVSSCGALVTYGEISQATRRKARRKGQAALLDYLHSTRNLQFLDADNISKNSPRFLEKILARIDYSEVCAVIFEFRGTEVGKFQSNLRRCFVFFNEIDMEPHEIGDMVRSRPLLLGSCALKKSSTLLSRLKTGKTRLCEAIQKDPLQMKNWVIGSKSEPLGPSDKQRSNSLKKQFLLDIGFTDNSEKMEKALKLIRGKGSELQDRFDCMVKAGLNEQDVCEMIKACPHVLNQSKEVIDMKISFIVNDLGYPMSSLVVYPKFLVRAAEFIKLRLSMYNWVRDQGVVDRVLAFSTVLNSSEGLFVRQYVNIHPRGPEVWQELKAKIYGS
ncbi:Transcription termination factor MTEF18, mitochondrial [Linum perenne]